MEDGDIENARIETNVYYMPGIHYAISVVQFICQKLNLLFRNYAKLNNNWK